MGRRTHLVGRRVLTRSDTCEEPLRLPALDRALPVPSRGFELPPRLLHVAEPEEREAEMEAYDRRVRILLRERTEARERLRRGVLSEAREGVGRASRHARRVGRDGPGKRRLRRERAAEPLQYRAVVEPLGNAAALRPALELVQLGLRPEPVEAGGPAAAGNKERAAGRHLRMEQVFGAKGGRGIRIDDLGPLPLGLRPREIAVAVERESEV